MKSVLVLILLSLPFTSQSQSSKKFYDRYERETDSIHSHYYKVIRYDLDSVTYSYYTSTNSLRHKEVRLNKRGEKHVTYYYENGGLQAEGNSLIWPLGKVITYLRNGEKKAEMFFPNHIDSLNELDGIRVFFYRDSLGNYMVKDGNGHCFCQFNTYGEGLVEEGDIKNTLKDGVWSGRLGNQGSFQELYENGKFIGGVSNFRGETYEYRSFEESAMPVGGMRAFYQGVAQKMTYTKRAMKKRIQGKVLVEFEVDTDGSIINTKVIKGIDPELDQIALDAVRSSPRWKPGNQRGRPVKQKMVIPLAFKIG
jgi:TonB family protein